MAEYITLHASAYPPTSWAFLANRQPRPPHASNNEFWTEMTNRYEQSMAERQHLVTNNLLSKTATDDNIGKMGDRVRRRHSRRSAIAFHVKADITDTLRSAEQFVNAVDDLCQNPMATIAEEDIFDTAYTRRQPTRKESLQIERAIRNARTYERLRANDEIERSFKARLDDIYSACHEFIWTGVGKHPRRRWAEICRMDREVTAHVSRIRQQVTSDVAQLRDFLRGQLFDQYCLMRETPMEKKDKTWLNYGDCIVLGYKNGDPLVGDRLDRMIDGAGLDPEWVMASIEDYYAGNRHIGRWQRYVQSCRWQDLAAKLSMDTQQLEKINSSNPRNSRRCNIMINIRNTQLQYFNRLDGAQDYDLSEDALRMDEEYESSSASSSKTSLETVS